MSNLAPQLQRLQTRVYIFHAASDELCALAAGSHTDNAQQWRTACDAAAAAHLALAAEWLDAMHAAIGEVETWLRQPVSSGGPIRYELLRAGLRAGLLAHAEGRVGPAYLCARHHPDWEHVADAGDGWRIAAQPSGQLALAPDELEHIRDARE